MSLFSDWNWENFSESGDNLVTFMSRIQAGSYDSGHGTFADLRPKRVLIKCDLNAENFIPVAEIAQKYVAPVANP
jgi:hypothetical protein